MPLTCPTHYLHCLKYLWLYVSLLSQPEHDTCYFFPKFVNSSPLLILLILLILLTPTPPPTQVKTRTELMRAVCSKSCGQNSVQSHLIPITVFGHSLPTPISCILPPLPTTFIPTLSNCMNFLDVFLAKQCTKV